MLGKEGGGCERVGGGERRIVSLLSQDVWWKLAFSIFQL